MRQRKRFKYVYFFIGWFDTNAIFFISSVLCEIQKWFGKNIKPLKDGVLSSVFQSTAGANVFAISSILFGAFSIVCFLIAVGLNLFILVHNWIAYSKMTPQEKKVHLPNYITHSITCLMTFLIAIMGIGASGVGIAGEIIAMGGAAAIAANSALTVWTFPILIPAIIAAMAITKILFTVINLIVSLAIDCRSFGYKKALLNSLKKLFNIRDGCFLTIISNIFLFLAALFAISYAIGSGLLFIGVLWSGLDILAIVTCAFCILFVAAVILEFSLKIIGKMFKIKTIVGIEKMENISRLNANAKIQYIKKDILGVDENSVDVENEISGTNILKDHINNATLLFNLEVPSSDKKENINLSFSLNDEYKAGINTGTMKLETLCDDKRCYGLGIVTTSNPIEYKAIVLFSEPMPTYVKIEQTVKVDGNREFRIISNAAVVQNIEKHENEVFGDPELRKKLSNVNGKNTKCKKCLNYGLFGLAPQSSKQLVLNVPAGQTVRHIKKAVSETCFGYEIVQDGSVKSCTLFSDKNLPKAQGEPITAGNQVTLSYVT